MSSSASSSRSAATTWRTSSARARVDFVDELPRLPTGKLYKGVLREQYWGDHATRIV